MEKEAKEKLHLGLVEKVLQRAVGVVEMHSLRRSLCPPQVEALELLLGPPSHGDSATKPGREPALCPETLRRNAAALEERLSRAAG